MRQFSRILGNGKENQEQCVSEFEAGHADVRNLAEIL